MPSIKALAAIAITLMIAVPIGLGYAFASEEVEKTTWEANSTTNISDLLLNSSTPYYTDFTGPENNNYLTIVGSNGIAPDYISVSTNYSSLPDWDNNLEVMNINGTTSISYVNYYSSPDSLGSPGSGADTEVTDSATVKVEAHAFSSGGTRTITLNYTTDDGTTTSVPVTLSDSSVNLVLQLAKDGASSWVLLYYSEEDNVETTVSDVTSWTLENWGGADVTYQDYTTLNVTSTTRYSFTAIDVGSAMITDADGGVHYYGGEITLVHTKTDGWNCEGDYWPNSTAAWAPGSFSSTISAGTYDLTGNYADPAAGWRLPIDNDAYIWDNEHQNRSVTLMLDFISATSVYLGLGDTQRLIEITYDGTTTYVDGLEDDAAVSTLGSYTKLMIILNTDGAKIYGIAAWPTMGTMPATYNSVELEYDGVSYVSGFYLEALSRSSVIFRVDSAEIVAGYYPSTFNYDLSLESYWPDQSVDIYINSVAIYGDNITIVNMDGDTTIGTVFPVTDGKITVDGEQVKLLHCHITSIKNSAGDWVTSIGDHVIMTTDEQVNVDFWGEWSFTVSLSTGSEVTSTQSEWVPGEFAFTKQDFAACGLLVAGALMVVLGMTGPRSGSKIALLGIICGGGALIYLTLI